MNSVTQANFQNEVLKSKTPVIVDLYTSICEPCKRISPILKQIATEKNGVVRIMKLNCMDEPVIASSLGIRSVPTFLMFSKGVVHSCLMGEKSKADIEKWIEEGLAGI